jgi:hypothetical protein
MFLSVWLFSPVELVNSPSTDEAPGEPRLRHLEHVRRQEPCEGQARVRGTFPRERHSVLQGQLAPPRAPNVAGMLGYCL